MKPDPLRPVPLSPAFQPMRQIMDDVLHAAEERQRARRDAQLVAQGLSLWIDRWTPSFLPPNVIMSARDHDLAHVMRTLGTFPVMPRA